MVFKVLALAPRLDALFSWGSSVILWSDRKVELIRFRCIIFESVPSWRVQMHCVNFVSPSHVAAQILAATLIAARHGLNLPLVYNTGGYDSPEALA